MSRPLDGNELLARWRKSREALPGDKICAIFDPKLSDKERGDLFEAEPEEAQEIYAWAIPDERALRICEAFAPIVEIGAGAGYWARLLRDRGVDVACYDKDVGDETRAAGIEAAPWTEVRRGGAEALKDHKASTLLLCYPDDHEDGGERETPLSVECLEAFDGDLIIHVGELFGDSLSVSMEGQETPDDLWPWGRSTDPRFQARLVGEFHKILQVPLPCWANARDTLSVWRRSGTSVVAGDRYAHVPRDERLSLELACPATAHLLAP